MEYLMIRNWGKYQHYSNRNPPWIKLHNSLLDDYEYGCLQDDSKLLLISLYLVAAKCNNCIPNDPEWIQQKAMLKKRVNLEPLISSGFLYISNGDGKPIAQCLQDDSKLLCQNRTEKNREEKRRDIYAHFETFWAAYPKKKNKKDALKAWRNAKDKPAIEIITEKLDELKNSNEWKKENGQFIPYPATWLNRGGWEDEINDSKRDRGHAPWFQQRDSEEDDNGADD